MERVMDGSESVRSGHSDRSGRSHRSGHTGGGGGSTNGVRSHHKRHSRSRSGGDHRGGSSHRSDRGGSSSNNNKLGLAGITTSSTAAAGDSGSHGNHKPGTGNIGNPYHTAGDDDDMIEVTIIPQDDNWGDNTTAITGATSERSISIDDINRLYKEEQSMRFQCSQYLGTALAAILSLFAFATPFAFVILPRVSLVPNWSVSECRVECEGLLISSSFKLVILLVGTWAVYFRRSKSTLPRVFIFRAVVLALTFLLTFCYWLFYAVRILESRESDYDMIVKFSVSLVDALLFLHYLAVVLLEIRQLQPQFTVRVVRSPDGVSRSYNLGQLSIQRAAVWVLEQYYRDFPVYNQYLDRVPSSSSGSRAAAARRNNVITQFKLYDIEGNMANNKDAIINDTTRAMMAANARKRDTSHNERFYEEQEYDRRVKRRKARLISAAEEAFTHINRLDENSGPAIPMEPVEAAQAVFPSLARALQKYLRITRQQPRYTLENILEHLATCISHDMSPRAFLERYLDQGHVAWDDKEHRPVQTWALVCDQFVSRALEDDCVFQLKNGEVSLLVHTRRIPHFNLTEEVIDPKNNRFVLRLNSETSV